MTWEDVRSGWTFYSEPGWGHVDVLTDDGQRRVDVIAKVMPLDPAEFHQELARAIDAYVYELMGE